MKIYVGRVSIGCSFSSVQLLDFICFSFSSFVVLLSSSFRHQFDAFEAKQDLFWSRVFWGFCHNEIFLSFLVFKRAFYLIHS